MATAQMTRMQKMRGTLSSTAQEVVGIASITLPLIARKLPLMRMVPTILMLDFHLLVQGGSFPCMRSEFELFVTEFATLITNVVCELSILGPMLSDATASSIGTAAEEMFWELWRILASSSQALAAMHFACSRLWPLDQQPFSIPLYLAFNSLMAWLLPMTRSSAWMAMSSRHGSTNRNKELIGMLGQPCKCISSLSMLPAQKLVTLFGTLPSTFLPLLCCILSEQFGGAPPIVRRLRPSTMTATTYTRGRGTAALADADFPSLLYVVTNAMHNLAIANNRTGNSGKFDFVSSPASLQMLKVALILPPKVLAGEVGLEECCMFELRFHLERSFCVPKARDGRSVFLGQYAMNMDTVGLPVHLHPWLSPGALETDARVLHAMSSIVAGSARLQEMCYSLQALIIGRWLVEDKGVGPSHDEVMSVMFTSVVGIAKQCTSQGLQMMQELRRVRRGQPNKAPSRTLRQEQEEQFRDDRQQQRESEQPGGQQQQHYHQERSRQMQRDAVTVKNTILNEADLSFSSEVRMLMFHTSSFRSDKVSSSTGLNALNAWRVMPGWAAATEVIYRGELRAADVPITVGCTAMRAFSHAMKLLTSPISDSSRIQALSLASTLRKLMWPHTQREINDPATGWQCVRNASRVAQGRWIEKEREKVTYVNDGFIQRAADAIIVVDSLIDLNSSGSRSSTSSSDNTTLGSVTTLSDCGMSSSTGAVCGLQQQRKGGDMTSQPEICSPTALRRQSLTCALHQQLTISVATLVRISLWLEECRHLGDDSRLFKELVSWLHTITSVCDRLQHMDLKAVMTLLLDESSLAKPRTQQDVNLVWERYAVSHFNGRLTPGCCNVGCGDLSGASEAALKTFLCSGCMRARYCSVDCQKAAWVEGGHSAVCER